ncbi:sulfur deficiency-induced 1-like protein [Tanacetum coccineum]
MEVNSRKKKDQFHIVHKVPSGDGPYVKAKHAQNEEEAIEAIKSFRRLCPKSSQESLDNVLIDLFKVQDAYFLQKYGLSHVSTDTRCIEMRCTVRALSYLSNSDPTTRMKSRYIRGEAFNGKPTKTARSHGKKFQVSVRQETSRILIQELGFVDRTKMALWLCASRFSQEGNLGWAYMQKSNFMAAEVVYKKAQMIDPDANKACNLGLCLIKQARYNEACSVLEHVVNGV